MKSMVINMKIIESSVKFFKAYTLQLATLKPYAKELIAYIHKMYKQGIEKYFMVCNLQVNNKGTD